MKYYVIADIHGFYEATRRALDEKGFFNDTEPHKLIICGDLFDRGAEARRLQAFIEELMARDEVILIKGNHEDLMVEMLDNFYDYLPSMVYTHHYQNGTYDTALALTRMNKHDVEYNPEIFRKRMYATPYLKDIIPSMLDYYETEHYVFVHGYIPCQSVLVGQDRERFFGLENWREASWQAWEKARWINGMAAWKCGVREEGKTIVCGHYHTSWGHSVIDGIGSEWGNDSVLEPFIKDGLIALDGRVAFTKKVNCIVIED